MDKINPNNGGSNSGNIITGGTFHQTSIASGHAQAKTIVTSDQSSSTSAELIVVLENLRKQFAQARQAGIVDAETAIIAKYQMTKAVEQAKQPNSDKKSIVDHLNEVKDLIGNIAAATGLVTAVAEAIKAVQGLF